METRESKVDLPTFGKPTRPTSAITFNSSCTQSSCAGCPGCAYFGTCIVESIRRETRNSRLLRIKLENTDSTEPLLWDINRRFEVETNILYSTINVIQGIVVGIMLVLFIGSDEEIKKAERYILESNEEYKEVVLP